MRARRGVTCEGVDLDVMSMRARTRLEIRRRDRPARMRADASARLFRQRSNAGRRRCRRAVVWARPRCHAPLRRLPQDRDLTRVGTGGHSPLILLKQHRRLQD